MGKGNRRNREESNDKKRRLVKNRRDGDAAARQAPASSSSPYAPPSVVSVPPATSLQTSALDSMLSGDTCDEIIKEVDHLGASDKYRPTPRSNKLIQESQQQWALSSSISGMDTHAEEQEEGLASHSTLTSTMQGTGTTASSYTNTYANSGSVTSGDYDTVTDTATSGPDDSTSCYSAHEHPPGMIYKKPNKTDPLAPPSMYHKNRVAPTFRFDPFAKPSSRQQPQGHAPPQSMSHTKGTFSSADSRMTGPMTMATSVSGLFRADDLSAWAEDDFSRVRQKTGYLSIGLSAFQLLVLMVQLALCGVAPLDVNPMVGPYPDAFSEWGGKNAYAIIHDKQLWRFITPAFLHVGVLHLLCNAAVQLKTCAFFEREWGSVKWFFIYIISEAGCVVMSCVVNPDTIAVGSSGALMGLFGAKLAQSLGYNLMEVERVPLDDTMRLEQLSSVLCMFAIVSLMSFITYIDWSGHMGGLAAGFFAGMFLFCGPIVLICERMVWGGIGLLVLVVGFACAIFHLFTEVEPDEYLSDACEYFRNLFSEEYDCECLLIN